MLKRPEARLSLREIIDPDAMVEIFFADTAERLTSLIPASILPLNIQAIKTGSIPENRSGLSSKNRLVLGYETGNPRAKLVAERVKVDLLVKKYNVVLREVMSGNYKGCDLFVFQSLISKTAPEYSLWLMLHDLYKKTGNDIWLHKPIKGIYKWIANITRDFLGAGYLIPLFQEDVFISVDKRLKGVTFRPDGTLNLENSWISSDGK